MALEEAPRYRDAQRLLLRVLESSSVDNPPRTPRRQMPPIHRMPRPRLAALSSIGRTNRGGSELIPGTNRSSADVVQQF